LPWELGIPDDYEVEIAAERGGKSRDGVLPARLRFRTVEVPGQLPLGASDLAFGSLHLDIKNDEDENARREEVVRGIIGKPFPLQRTVVAVYVPVRDDPPLLEADPLSRGLNSALRNLNAWLISLGVLYDDRVRPLSVGDLAPAIPVIPVGIANGKLRHGKSELFHLRKYPEDVRRYDLAEMDQVERMLQIVASEEGLSSFYELVQRAGSARRASRDREAVIDYATAGELFITTMLSVIGEGRVDPPKLKNLLEGPFHDRSVHLCRLLNVPSEPDDPESPLFYWWMHCYTQRNQIVHEGADSMAALSEVARIGLVQMVVDIREAMRRDPHLVALASMIQWGKRVDHTGGGGDSEPDPLPRL
jgi:hypothetical protein